MWKKELNEEEEVILHKCTIIMKMERKMNSYQNYLKLNGKELEALNALVQGVALYYELLPEADEYRVMGEIDAQYQQILAVLYEQYGLSEADVMDIIYSEDDITYTQKIASVLYGTAMPAEEEQTGGMKDVLPEEQEILDGLPEETADIVTNDTTDAVIDGSQDDLSNDAPGEAGNGTTDDNMLGETSDNGSAADGTAVSDDGVKYIDPISVEVHQNN